MPKKAELKTKYCPVCDKEFRTRSERQCCSSKCEAILRGYKFKDTLCWNCDKAKAIGNCPWADNFEPVPGWEATPHIFITSVNGTDVSYEVKKCPLYVRDKRTPPKFLDVLKELKRNDN